MTETIIYITGILSLLVLILYVFGVLPSWFTRLVAAVLGIAAVVGIFIEALNGSISTDLLLFAVVLLFYAFSGKELLSRRNKREKIRGPRSSKIPTAVDAKPVKGTHVPVIKPDQSFTASIMKNRFVGVLLRLSFIIMLGYGVIQASLWLLMHPESPLLTILVIGGVLLWPILKLLHYIKYMKKHIISREPGTARHSERVSAASERGIPIREKSNESQ